MSPVHMPKKTTFWDEFVKTALSIGLAFCIAGIILGLIFSEEARIALAVIVFFLGMVGLITWVRGPQEKKGDWFV